MKTKAVLFAGLTIVIACVVGVMILVQRQRAREAAAVLAAKSESTGQSRPPAPLVATLGEKSGGIAGSTPVPEVKTETQTDTNIQPATEPNAAGLATDPVTDPLARVALSMVGLDLDAELYWVASINDPTLPAAERQDLIEDLNEVGLADPKHPTPDDLPLILSRLELIEELWPWAMDGVNDEAFDEAYKDLENLAELAQGRGEPVK